MTTVTKVGMPLDEFMRRYDEQPFEIIDGEIIEMSPSVSKSSYLANKLARIITLYAFPKGLGEALVEMVFVVSHPDETQWVKGSRVPDMIFLPATLFETFKAENPDWGDDPLRLLPPLVVEVISPTDRFADVQRKVESYLQDGVQLVWVIDPANRTVTIATPHSNQQTVLHEADTLTAEGIIEGFELPLKDLFEG